MDELKIYLSNGEIRTMESSLESFINEYLDEKGNFKVGYVGFDLVNLKNDPTTMIFSNHIVGIEEVKV